MQRACCSIGLACSPCIRAGDNDYLIHTWTEGQGHAPFEASSLALLRWCPAEGVPANGSCRFVRTQLWWISKDPTTLKWRRKECQPCPLHGQAGGRPPCTPGERKSN